MGTPIVTSCCCCCSLRTGVTIIAWYSLIIYLLLTMHYSTWKVLPDNIKNQVTRIDPTYRQDAEAGFSIFIFMYGLLFLSSIFLVVGAHKEHPGYMLPYVVINSIAIVIQLIVLIVLILNNGFQMHNLVTILVIMLNVYFSVVVYSLFAELRPADQPSIL